jgi:cytochrome P450
MVLHPEIQKKARTHIAAVVAPGMLPAFGDEPSLPYITAIVMEILRWRPATPFGMHNKYSLAMVD